MTFPGRPKARRDGKLPRRTVVHLIRISRHRGAKSTTQNLAVALGLVPSAAALAAAMLHSGKPFPSPPVYSSPEILGTTSKPNGKPRKYQSGPSPRLGRIPRGMGIAPGLPCGWGGDIGLSAEATR